MQVELRLTLNLPDYCERMDPSELEQVVYDGIVGFVIKKHHEAALRWAAKSNVGMPDEDPTGKRLYEFHEVWGDIADNMTWALTAAPSE